MKTKAEIVQRLLESKQVDAEEAVVLLMSDKEVQYIPYVPYNPYPYYPIGPIWVGENWTYRPDVDYCETHRRQIEKGFERKH